MESLLKSKIILFAKLKDIVGNSELRLELDEGSTVADLKNELILQFPNLRDYVEIMIVSINQNFAFDNDLIPENSEIALFPPVSGGASEENDTVDIIDNDFEFNSLINNVIEKQTGAVVMFTGVIRG